MAAAAAGEEERLELEVEVAAILCDFKRILRARDRRRMRRQQSGEEAPVVPSWGRRRLRSVLEDGRSARVAERDGAASPDTPLAFPDSVPAEEDDDAAKKGRAQEEWVQEQRVVVASLSQENADLLKQIEEYKARLMSSRSANESLKQLHKVRLQREQEEHARKMRQRTRHPLAALGLDLNEPAEEAAAQERFWQVQKAAATAEARRRRLEILRAKVASPLVSCRTRRVVG